MCVRWVGQAPTAHQRRCKMYTVFAPNAKTACRIVCKCGLPFITNFTQNGHEKWVKYIVLIVQMRLWLCMVIWECRRWETFLERLQRTPEAGPVHALKCITALKVWLESGIFRPSHCKYPQDCTRPTYALGCSPFNAHRLHHSLSETNRLCPCILPR